MPAPVAVTAPAAPAAPTTPSAPVKNGAPANAPQQPSDPKPGSAKPDAPLTPAQKIKLKLKLAGKEEEREYAPDELARQLQIAEHDKSQRAQHLKDRRKGSRAS